ncbi:phosphotriesterase family protein [Microtetraspora malaysiensis]|uniref:phosphotriesterase family protein n=1 Tax=Microtetraspora malaysiensis TaxID=161358 RepID=UPI003D8A15BA
MTATGAVEGARLGTTLMHEHVFINLLREYRGTGLIQDLPLMRSELERYREAGGVTLVDVTSAELTWGASPDPGGVYGARPPASAEHTAEHTRAPDNVAALHELSVATGVRIVLGTGHYRDPYLGDDFDRKSVDAISELLVRDLVEGFAGTRIRAGLIGEVGSDQWFISAREERNLRASARASRRTNAVISTHAARWPVGRRQLDLLLEEGVSPVRVIIGHCDTVNIPEYHLDLARSGCYVQFDTIRPGAEFALNTRVSHIVSLIRAGFIDSILLSHDVCGRDHLHAYGGGGFDYISRHFAKRLAQAGVDAGELDHILIENPRRALSGEAG